jgi:hypothetical protein
VKWTKGENYLYYYEMILISKYTVLCLILDIIQYILCFVGFFLVLFSSLKAKQLLAVESRLMSECAILEFFSSHLCHDAN